MEHQIIIPEAVYRPLRAHLFQNRMEQGAFLLARPENGRGTLRLRVFDLYPIHPTGWDTQSSVYLEMADAERARVMKVGRDGGWSLIECHSHPGSGSNVHLSQSDHAGLSEFVPYARWKLDGRPYAALVWGEASVDGRIWHGDFQIAWPITAVLIKGRLRHTTVGTAKSPSRWIRFWRQLWGNH